MKEKFRRGCSILLALVIVFSMISGQMSMEICASSAETVIIPNADTVTIGNANTNSVTNTDITFCTNGGYATSTVQSGVFKLFKAYTDITSALMVYEVKKDHAFVLKFTEPIDVSEKNVMTINMFMGRYTGTDTVTTHLFASGENNLTTTNVKDTFETAGNQNKEQTWTLDLTKYADADGYVKNLTFLCDSTLTSNYYFGAFRLTYVEPDDGNDMDDGIIIPTADTVTAGNASTNGVTDTSITFKGDNTYQTSGGVYNLFKNYTDITSVLISTQMVENKALVLEFKTPINVSTYNTMTINMFVGGYTGTDTITTYVYASGANDLSITNAKDTFTTEGNKNKEQTWTLDLTKYADTDGYVKNLTFRCATTLTGTNFYFGAFRLTYVEPDDGNEGGGNEGDGNEDDGNEDDGITYTELTFTDFGIADGTYTGQKKGIADISSLDKVAISGKIIFGDKEEHLRIIGTSENNYKAIASVWISNGTTLKAVDWNTSGTEVALAEKQPGDEIDFRVTFVCSGENILVKYYIDGKYVAEYTSVGTVGIIVPTILTNGGKNGTTFVSRGSVPKEPIVQQTPEELGFKQITLSAFGLSNDFTYAPGQVAGNNQYATYIRPTLDMTYLNVDVTFSETTGGSSIRYASADKWRGIMIYASGTMLNFVNAEFGTGVSFTAKELGLTSLTEKFNLKLGVKLGDFSVGIGKNGKEQLQCDEIQMCIWINDTLVAKDAVLKNVIMAGNGIGINTPNGEVRLSTPDGAPMGIDFTIWGFTKNWRKELGLK